MATRQRVKQDAGPPRPPADFGRRAIELAVSIGKSREDLRRAAGYDDRKTLDRLVNGKGTFLSAMAVKKALKNWGIDVSQLPPLDPDGAAADSPGEEWLLEWIELGKRLRQVASDDRFEVEVRRVRKLIEAHELVAEGLDQSE